MTFFIFRCLSLQEIYEAGEARWGTDEVKFLTVLCVRNRKHLLRGTFTTYPQTSSLNVLVFMSVPCAFASFYLKNE